MNLCVLEWYILTHQKMTEEFPSWRSGNKYNHEVVCSNPGLIQQVRDPALP